jgi:hypothetical protein
MSANPKLGIIAGNGRLPLLVLDAACAQGYEVVVAAIREETSPEIESRDATVLWLSLGYRLSAPTGNLRLLASF